MEAASRYSLEKIKPLYNMQKYLWALATRKPIADADISSDTDFIDFIHML